MCCSAAFVRGEQGEVDHRGVERAREQRSLGQQLVAPGTRGAVPRAEAALRQ